MGSQHAMPMIMINMGCEMLYILEQRLKAQAIDGDKSNRVLHDVVKTMFDKSYIEKLFIPQEVYSVSSTRKMFDKLAHSSIMKLSESSMDKLFDLMMMGFKYQLVCATRLEQMVEVSKLHLSTVRGMVSSFADKATVELLDNVEAYINKTYTGLRMGQLHALRQTLLRFFQDKRVKVSVFLQEGIQSPVGRLIHPSPNNSYVGTVTYYDLSGGLEQQDKIRLEALQNDPNEFFVHPCPLGTNLYNKDRPKVVPPVRKGDPMTSPARGDDEEQPRTYDNDLVGGRHARQELDLLSTLLNLKPPATDNFKLNLFEGDDFGMGSAGGGKVQTLTFGTGGKNEAYKTGAAGLGKVLNTLNIDSKSGQGDSDDLLDLLDKSA